MKKDNNSLIKKIKWLFSTHVPVEEYSLEENRDIGSKIVYYFSYPVG